MKVPVGLLSDRTVCVSGWRGLIPTSSDLLCYSEYTILANEKKKNAPTYEKPGILLLPDVPNQFCAVRQELRGQKMSKYFMFVSFPPYGTLTVVCHAFL